MKKIALLFLFAFGSYLFISCSEEGSGNNCPTTSACGCSSYTKSECESHTDCCKWTTGQGCGCK